MKKMFSEQVDRISKECGEMIKAEVKKMNQEMRERVAQMEEEVGKKTETSLREIRRDLEGLRRMKKDSNPEKLEKMNKEIEEIKRMKEQNLEEGDLVLKKDLEAVRKEIVSRGVEEIRREKREEGKMMEMIGERVEEMERERRKKNVMIFNLRELELDEATEGYREDEENIGVLLLEEMGVEDIQIEKIIRLGKKNERNRPLLVRLRDEKSRGEIMKRSSRLRRSIRFFKVYITKDMTESERENDKKLRNELREKRGRGGASFVIRKGRVMER